MPQFVTLDDYKRKPRPPAPPVEGAGEFAGKKKETPPPTDDRSQLELAATRVAKFIPSVIVLGYAGLCNLVNSKDPVHDAGARLVAFVIIFWFCYALTPCYTFYFTRKNRLRWRNILVGIFAFPIWAYAFPCGWFVDSHKYDPIWAGCLLLGFSMLTALIPAPKLEEN